MNMEDRIFEVVIPMEDVIEFKNGKKVVVQKKVFPGYLLVRCDLDDDSWYVIRNTPGVTGFVGLGAKPTPLRAKTSRAFLQVKPEGTEGTKKTRPRLEYEVGESVRVKEGPFADFSGADRRDQRGPAQAQGARQHLRPGDSRSSSSSARSPSSKTADGRNASHGQEDASPRSSRSRSPPAPPRPAPPVGTALGPHGVNIMDFCKQYNAATEAKRGTIIPVEITIFEDRSFTFITKTPPTPVLLRAGRRAREGLADPGQESAGTVTDAQSPRSPQTKMPDLNANDLDAAKLQVAGTARSMGITGHE